MSTDPAFPTTAGWRPHPRYPDPAIAALDARFEQYWLKQSAVERLYTGCRWSGTSGSKMAVWWVMSA